MATGILKTSTFDSSPNGLAPLQQRLGDLPPDRIRLSPTPGSATERDLIAALDGPGKRLCELVDGILVEKPMGTTEALIAGVIVHLLWNFVERKDLGLVIGADGPFRLKLGLVRLPDVSFISWSRLPGGRLPDRPIAPVVPDLAVEVLSKSNTAKEIERKLREYFEAGVRVDWVIQPRTRTALVYTSPKQRERIGRDGVLEAGDVLPGFKLPLAKIFSRIRRRGQ